MKVAQLLSNHTFAITLPRDHDRLARLHASFDRYGVRRPTMAKAVDARDPRNKERINAVIHTPGRHTFLEFPTEVACAMSHVAVLTHAVKAKLDYVVVFEDDIALCPFTPELLQYDLPADWDVLYLGHCTNVQPRNAANVVQPYKRKPVGGWIQFDSSSDCAFGMYAYAMRPAAARRLLESYTFHCPFDYHLMKNHANFRVYGLHPGLVIHDYRFGSYSNPLRHEDYTLSVHVLQSMPLLVFTAALGMLSPLHPALAALTMILLPLSYAQGRFESQQMARLKQAIGNFPGVRGVDSYAPFHDALSAEESKTMVDTLKSLPWTTQGLFLWGHSLLGHVRDGRPIPWERQAVVAKPAHFSPVTSPHIRWLDYTQDDQGRFHLADGSQVIAFRPTVDKGMGVPPTPELYLQRLYGADCMQVVRSPSTIDIGGIRWRVPQSFKTELIRFRADGPSD